MAQKRRARSTTIASGCRNAPRASRNVALVKRKRETSEPPIARASSLPLLDPSEIESRQKREKRPETAARCAEALSLTERSSRVTASHAHASPRKLAGVDGPQADRVTLRATGLGDLGAPARRPLASACRLERDAAVADVEHRRSPGARLAMGKDAQIHLVGGKAGMVPPVALREVGLFPAVVEAQVGDLQEEVGRVSVRRVGGDPVMHAELDAAARQRC